MSIEFYCPHCDSRLRTPEDRAGHWISCPVCAEQIAIPNVEGTGPPQLSGTAFNRTFEEAVGARKRSMKEFASSPEQNDQPPSGLPQCLRCGAPLEHSDAPCSDCQGAALSRGRTRSEDVALILSRTWQIYTKHFGLCLLASLLDLLVTISALSIIVVLALTVLLVFPNRGPVAAFASLSVFTIGVVTVLSALTVGNLRFFLALSRGSPVSLATAFRHEKGTGTLIIGSCLFWGMVLGGLMMCVIPGLLALILFWPYSRLIVDQDSSALNSLKRSYELTHQHWQTTSSICLVHLLVWVGASGLPILGHMIALPFAAILYSVTYLLFLESVTTIHDHASDL